MRNNGIGAFFSAWTIISSSLRVFSVTPERAALADAGDAGKAITPASHRRWKTAGFNLGDLALSHGITSSY
ncbi:hypothetical protein IE4872_PD00697 (plasmid) [Rhizobium gallicum]|uniref:Uncharacterized protein n=1 Tax=Rhizobium gallicum TaxID=56730 RepID=A0A1L5NTK0_9HYPH|nr:hypothetical protein IE4872_PD00697 [Rhizobium gallicum]